MKQLIATLVMTLFIASCSSLPDNDNPVVQIVTSKGDITIELFEDDAPNSVANFITLAESGFYKGCSFHRILKNFMAQGGCPNTKPGASGYKGCGGPGYFIDNELSPKLKHQRGFVSMAQSGANRVGAQFCIFFKSAPHLDGKFTIFGKVIDGMDVVDELEAVGANRNAVPPSESVSFDIKVIRKRDHQYKVEKNQVKVK